MTTTAQLLTRAGLEAMQAIIYGAIPPPTISTTLGFRLSKVERGVALFIGEPSDRILSPLGVVHGGFALTLIDRRRGVHRRQHQPARPKPSM